MKHGLTSLSSVMPAVPTTIRPVALYARVSTDEQREGQTINSQIDELRRFAEHKGWVVLDVYQDDGWSGGILGRPALDRLRDDASKGLFGAVIVNDVDRLARDVSHLGIIKRDLERRGVQIVFRKLPSGNTPTNNLLVNILGSFAEFERELIADRTRRGRRHKAEVRQQFVGSLAPYGFRYLPKRHGGPSAGSLDLVQDAVAVVRDMYRWVDAEALSARQVVSRLNALKVPPPRGGRCWQRSSVRRILRSEVYTGIWYYNKWEHCEPRACAPTPYRKSIKSSARPRPRSEWIPVALPERFGIIDRDRWERVQQQLDRNRVFSLRNAIHNYLLRGLVRCGACDRAWVGDPCHGRYFYRCSSRCRSFPAVPEDLLNEAVWNTILKVVLDPAILLDRIRALTARQCAESARLATEKRDVADALSRLAEEESRLLEAYRAGALTPALLARELEKVSVRRSALENRPATASEGSAVAPHVIEKSIRDVLQAVARRIPTLKVEERQQLLRLLLVSVIVRGHTITIVGRIPPTSDSVAVSSTPDLPSNAPKQGPRVEATEQVQSVECRIVDTATGGCGHNPSRHVEFEVVAGLEKPLRPSATVSRNRAA
ncbi:MAG: recombinase family protein [Vicinamibacteria bacterium]